MFFFSAHGLSRVGARAVRTLLIGLRDVDAHVRQAAARALLRIDDAALLGMMGARMSGVSDWLPRPEDEYFFNTHSCAFKRHSTKSWFVFRYILRIFDAALLGTAAAAVLRGGNLWPPNQ